MEFSPIRLNLASHDTFGIKIQEFLALFDFDSKSSGPMTFYRIKHENKPIIEISTLSLDNRLEIKLALLDSAYGYVVDSFFKWLSSTYNLELNWIDYHSEILTQKILESFKDEPKNSEWRQAIEASGLTIEQVYELSKQGLYKPLQKRDRKVSIEVLYSSRDAMAEWLDNGISITAAAELNGTDPKTIRSHIEAVLYIVEPAKRDKWIQLLKALGELDKDYTFVP